MPGLPHSGQRLPALFLGLLIWPPVFGALWFVLAGELNLFGSVVVVAATLSALLLGLRPRHIRLHRLPEALLLFLWELLRGAINVAVLALRPDPGLRPIWVRYQLQSDDRSIQLLVSAIVGLLPGTVSSRIDDGAMTLHLLDREMEWEVTIARIERKAMQLLVKGPR